MILWDDLLMCDCAGCGREILGETMLTRLTPAELADLGMPVVRGRVLGRPYCAACLDVRRPPSHAGRADDGGGPGWDNGVRHLEGE